MVISMNSSAIICCTAMVDPVNLTQDEKEQLVNELRELEKILSEKSGSWNLPASERIKVLIRIIDELDEKSVLDLLSSNRMDKSWMVLDLENYRFPQLSKLQSSIECFFLEKDTDVLTGLYNNVFFQRILDRELERTLRFKNPVTVAVLNIDEIDDISRNYGNRCVDAILLSLANVLRRQIRATDHIARISGQNFGMIIPGTGVYRSDPLFQRIIEAVKNEKVNCGSIQGQKAVRYALTIVAATYRGRTETSAENFLFNITKQLQMVKKQGQCSILVRAPVDSLREDSIVQREEKEFLFKG